MRIEDDIKLDYSDVLIRPKRSEARSRKDVKLERTFRFKHSSVELDCLPIIAANMDGVGTVKMAEKLQQVYKALTFLTKSEHDKDERYPLNFGIPIGFNDDITSTFKTIDDRLLINLDVANGYTKVFSDHVRNVRRAYPNAIISAGNVVTAEQTQELILNGADIVKVGIGPGCFTPDTEVLTTRGWVPINGVTLGDMVMTHSGNTEKVTHLWTFTHHEEMSTVTLENNTEYQMTPDHKVYAVHSKYVENINSDDDIRKYAEWVPAKDLNDEWYVVEE